MAIPTGIIDPKYIDPRYLFLYSAHKMGKTDISLALTRQYNKDKPIACMLPLECGQEEFAGVYMNDPPIQLSMTVWDKFKVLRQWLDEIKAANYPFKYLITDSVTALDEWSEWWGTWMYMESNAGQNFNKWTAEDVINKKCKESDKGKRKPINKWESVLEGLGQNGYRWTREAYYYWLEEIMKSAPYHVFLGHIREKLEDKAGQMVSVTDIDLTGKIRSRTAKLVSTIGILYAKENERWVSFKPMDNNFNGGAGSRCVHLRDKEIRLSWKEDDRINYDWTEIFTELK
jgi:hypothetical protein